MTLNPNELLGAAVARPQGGRVIRPMGEDDEGTEMPTGVYDRKARAAKSTDDAAPLVRKKPGRKPGRKRRAVAVVPEVAARVNGSKGRFDVALDLRAGAVTINATNGSLTLAPDEVLALFAFLGRK